MSDTEHDLGPTPRDDEPMEHETETLDPDDVETEAHDDDLDTETPAHVDDVDPESEVE
ncbi:hypothetical protein BJ980_000165 [Nocardioides daedukensis]|uniref:Uncharacterized protein n=1 Tax=Nocardioides daedukensis TaxID=634462 RepID=A0A7Y9RYS6_9ACTN|nr:hypothetical protein [Nocardioides daedukensis]NYG57242.1 hypothetical protein [Nocardioides daedukensis]